MVYGLDLPPALALRGVACDQRGADARGDLRRTFGEYRCGMLYRKVSGIDGLNCAIAGRGQQGAVPGFDGSGVGHGRGDERGCHGRPAIVQQEGNTKC